MLTLAPGQTLVAATHNPGKAREIAVLLEGRFTTIAAGALGLAEPAETEATFMGNAVLKARLAADASGHVALADDSGLCITALKGAPGVLSARWAEVGETGRRDFAVAMQRVEAAVRDSGDPDRSAHFVCALALAWPNGPVLVVEGRIDGEITFPVRGDLGFGYDPIFTPEGGALTFGEMPPAAKDALSHRARAFEKLKAAIF